MCLNCAWKLFFMTKIHDNLMSLHCYWPFICDCLCNDIVLNCHWIVSVYDVHTVIVQFQTVHSPSLAIHGGGVRRTPKGHRLVELSSWSVWCSLKRRGTFCYARYSIYKASAAHIQRMITWEQSCWCLVPRGLAVVATCSVGLRSDVSRLRRP